MPFKPTKPNTILSVLSLSLLSLVASFGVPGVAGDSKDDGGNYSAVQVSKEVKVLSMEIHASLSSYKDFLLDSKVLTEASWRDLEASILHAKTLVEYGELTVLLSSQDGVSGSEIMVPVDAINNDESFHVRISAKTWPLLDSCSKQRLLLHEFASLADLDTSLRTQFSSRVVALLPRCQVQQYEFESFEDLAFPYVEDFQF